MDPISQRTFEVPKAEFESVLGIKNSTASKVSSSAQTGLNQLSFTLKDKSTGTSTMAVYDAQELYDIALAKILNTTPLERDAKGMVLLEPKDPLVKAKTHFLMEMFKDEIIKELKEQCPSAKRELLQNSLEMLLESQGPDFDAVDILTSLKINGPVSADDVDKAVAKFLTKQYDLPLSYTRVGMEKFHRSEGFQKQGGKALTVIEEQLKSPAAMVKFINTHVIDKKMQIAEDLKGGFINGAVNKFRLLSSEERKALGTEMVRLGVPKKQILEFSIELDVQSQMVHVPSEVPSGQSPATFWKQLGEDRAIMMKAVETELKKNSG